MTAATTSTTPLRVATFNICSGRVGGASGTPAHLGPAIADLDADVIALQEVDRGQERSGGADQTRDAALGIGPGAHWRFAPTLFGTPGGAWVPAPSREARSVCEHGSESAAPSYGIALLSRYPVVHWSQLLLPAAPVRSPLVLPPLTDATRRTSRPKLPGLVLMHDEPRVALAAVVAAPGGMLTVVAAHLSFAPGWNVHQLLRIRSWIKAEQQAGAFTPALILAGDLNLPGRLPSLAGGLQRGVRAATFPAERPRVQLDHLLPSPGLHLRNGRAVRQPISDHCALIADATVG